MSAVTVARKWKDAEITHTVTFDQDGVQIECPLEMFCVTVAQSMSDKVDGPILVCRRSQIRRLLETAFAEAVRHMKESTARG